MTWRCGSLVFALSALLAASACRGDEPPASVTVERDLGVPVAAQPARLGTLRAVIRTTGVVAPAAGAEFIASASEPARIVEIPKAEGDSVASGDLLVRFDMPSAAADAVRQRAEVARAQAQLENARIAQGRARNLVERGIISRREMEDADREVAVAQADVSRAEAARSEADAASARMTIRAPFAGIVAQRLHDPDDLVQGVATDPILRLVDPGRLEILASIPAADAPRVLPGAVARLDTLAGAAPIRLTVAARPSTRSADPGGDVVVWLVFAEPTALAVDTRVDIEIDGEERVNAVLVPAEALIRDGNETRVLVAVGDKARRRVVTTGLANDEQVEITSGVARGDLIITRGHIGLADGATISVDAFAR